MIDKTTHEPLNVSKDGEAGPYIMVPVDQIDGVCTILDANGMPYWVDEAAISLDGKPEIAVVNLGFNIDPTSVQEILDKAV